jgi:hypothetical protein
MREPCGKQFEPRLTQVCIFHQKIIPFTSGACGDGRLIRIFFFF